MNPLVQNLFVLVCVALGGRAAIAFVRAEQWQRPRARLRRDRIGMVSLAVIAIYLLVGLADLVISPVKDANGRPLTMLDLAFRNMPRETSYSAPLAQTNEKGSAQMPWARTSCSKR
jgi:hypothetical protein